ncbi:MAG TPA: hypothetical protein VFP98_02845 [Candidatus Polarisedimenticolia bacterium]|nr:hypothetical protein [Candidatus Polarisedimenticolia bacterium]
MSRPIRTVRTSALLAAAWLLGSGTAAARPVDCFADEVVAFQAVFTPPENGLRVAELPGVVTGPPGDSFPVSGSTSTASLGRGGWILLKFTDNRIVDGPGPDFIVFENAFFRSFVPADPNQAYSVFAEPASVAVSEDGVTFFEFPYDPAALSQVGQDATPSSALPMLHGLAGVTPTFTGNFTIPDDPLVWDPSGSGGVSGAGGDAFDLAEVGLQSARYVLIADLGLPTGFAGSAEGFDIDSVVALHSIPTPADLHPVAAAPDTDGDGVSDAEETIWLGTDPADADTDGDGEPDGVEAARCRSPHSASTAPWFVAEPDLVARASPGTADTFVVWSFIASTATYDVVRGTIAAPGQSPQQVACLEDNSFNLTTADHPDPQLPSVGSAFLYLVRVTGQAHYGRGTDGSERTFAAGDCVP